MALINSSYDRFMDERHQISFLVAIHNIIIIIPILIWVYPWKRGWPDLPHSGSNLSNSHSPSHSIQCILLLQTNTPALLLHLHFPCLPQSSSLPFSLHFKLNSNAFLKTCPSSLFNTCLYHLTPLAFAI